MSILLAVRRGRIPKDKRELLSPFLGKPIGYNRIWVFSDELCKVPEERRCEFEGYIYPYRSMAQVAVVEFLDFVSTQCVGILYDSFTERWLVPTITNVASGLLGAGALALLKTSNHDARITAWEDVRLVSVLVSVSNNFSEASQWRALQDHHHTDYAAYKLRETAAYALMHRINDNPRFSKLRRVCAAFEWETYKMLRPKYIVAVASPIATYDNQSLTFNEHNTALAASCMMYADIVFRHERAGYTYISFRDYESDVKASAYDSAHADWPLYEKSFNHLVKAAEDQGIPGFIFPWKADPLNRNHIFDWPDLYSILYNLSLPVGNDKRAIAEKLFDEKLFAKD